MGGEGKSKSALGFRAGCAREEFLQGFSSRFVLVEHTVDRVDKRSAHANAAGDLVDGLTVGDPFHHHSLGVEGLLHGVAFANGDSGAEITGVM